MARVVRGNGGSAIYLHTQCRSSPSFLWAVVHKWVSGSDRNPSQMRGKKVFLPLRGWALLKSSWKDQEGIPAFQKF